MLTTDRCLVAPLIGVPLPIIDMCDGLLIAAGFDIRLACLGLPAKSTRLAAHKDLNILFHNAV
jgi:hypothetical protein